MARPTEPDPPELQAIKDAIQRLCDGGMTQQQVADLMGWKDQGKVSRFLAHSMGWDGLKGMRGMAKIAPDQVASMLGLSGAHVGTVPFGVRFPELEMVLADREWRPETVEHARALASTMWAEPGEGAWLRLMRAYEQAHEEQWASEDAARREAAADDAERSAPSVASSKVVERDGQGPKREGATG